MRCVYCGVAVTNYPDDGICVHCGGKLPARPAGTRCPGCGADSSGNFCSACGRAVSPAQPVYAPVQPVYAQTPHAAPMVGCPQCRSTQVITTTRGFSWGLAILGFFLIPVFGVLLGFCGRRNRRYQCRACGKKWKP